MELVLQGIVVDVIQHCARTEEWLAMLVEVDAEDLDEFRGWG